MTQINPQAPILVTGATGYVAGQLIKKLLAQGHRVHAAVRDPDNKAKLRYLDALAAELPGTIQYFQADLLSQGSYQPAMQGCELVFHTASPFTLNIRDPQKDLVEPAQLGTRNVLQTTNTTDSVMRVVLTSSCAAIYGDSADLQQTPQGVFTEDVWNTSSSLTHQPYSYSKTLAEKEAWKIAEAQTRWDLVVVNPSLVIGPGINPDATSESYNLFKQLCDGTLKAGAPHWELGAVDVRDLAEAHYRAGFTPEAKGRHIISAHNTSLFGLAQSLADKYGDSLPLPRKTLPKWLLWLVGPLADKNMTRKMVSLNVNLPWRADNSKGLRELGMRYRPLQESTTDFVEHLIEGGRLQRPQ